MSSDVSRRFLSSTIVPTTPSERSQCSNRWVILSSSLLLAEPRAHLLLLYLTYFCCNRYKNETKKETLSSETIDSFCLPQSFRRRLRNDLSRSFSSSLLLAEPRAHLPLLYLTYFCCKIQKRNEEKKETLSSEFNMRFLSSTIVPTTPSERSQHYVMFSSSLLLAEPRAHFLLLYLTYF